MNIGLLILRLAVGLTLAAHGGQKLFGWFGGGGIAGTAPAMEHLGFRPGRVQALLAGLSEFGGGLFLAAGLLTPPAAAVCVGVMVVAGLSAHWKNGFFLTKGGFEYTFILAAAAAGIAFTGPGRFSLDRALAISWPDGTAALAVAVGIVGGAVQLRMRRPSAAAAARQPS